MWDIGGQDRSRALWRHYLTKTDSLIFVIDSSDVKRLAEAKTQLFKIVNELNSQVESFTLLILANKQDLPTSLKPIEISEYLDLKRNLKDGQLFAVVGTDALNGKGLIDGLSWISHHHK